MRSLSSISQLILSLSILRPHDHCHFWNSRFHSNVFFQAPHRMCVKRPFLDVDHFIVSCLRTCAGLVSCSLISHHQTRNCNIPSRRALFVANIALLFRCLPIMPSMSLLVISTEQRDGILPTTLSIPASAELWDPARMIKKILIALQTPITPTALIVSSLESVFRSWRRGETLFSRSWTLHWPHGTRTPTAVAPKLRLASRLPWSEV